MSCFPIHAKQLAQVQGVEIRHHEHEFEKADSNENDYDSGIRVEAGVLYNGNDFEDISKVELFIEGANMSLSGIAVNFKYVHPFSLFISLIF